MPHSSRLFTPIKLRELTIKNRLFVSPMCQYSAVDGVPNDWHLVHLGSRAVGGAGLVMIEATGVTPEARISPQDLGIWNDTQVEAFLRITAFIKAHGAVPGVQLAHAGRKGSTHAPWTGSGAVPASQGGWTPLAPSPVAFAPDYPQPHAMTVAEIEQSVTDFVSAAKRALAAGFEVVELHFAHGYLHHQFLSPLSNQRTDEYGGSLQNRMRFSLAVAREVRAVWPKHLPLFARISATDWAPQGGWDLEQSIVFAAELKKIGVDLIDCSSGGTLAQAAIPVGPGYQVQFASEIRKRVGIATSAVGMITSGAQAETILRQEQADVISVAREFLRDPYLAQTMAAELGVVVAVPQQYGRGKR